MKKKNLFWITYLIILVSLFSLPALADHPGAHEGGYLEPEYNGQTISYGEQIKYNALNGILIAAAIVAVVTAISLMLGKKKKEKVKTILMLLIIIPVVAATLYSAVTTVYLNSVSWTGGPVHWHTDFEIRLCGEMVDLEDPTGLTNRIGTPVFHEHNDNRIHVEGVVLAPPEVTLKRFFQVIGGFLEPGRLVIPTNDGTLDVRDGDTCGGQKAKWQAFVYRTKGKYFWQEKIPNYWDYISAPHAIVPPGDCLILEFAPEKERTDYLCTTFEVSKQRGDIIGR